MTMKRFSMMFAALLSISALVVVSGCSSPDKADNPAAAKSSKNQPIDPSTISEENATKLAATWKWPAGAGAERDLLPDHAACANAKSDMDSPPLVRLRAYGVCMESKGWQPAAG